MLLKKLLEYVVRLMFIRTDATTDLLLRRHFLANNSFPCDTCGQKFVTVDLMSNNQLYFMSNKTCI